MASTRRHPDRGTALADTVGAGHPICPKRRRPRGRQRPAPRAALPVNAAPLEVRSLALAEERLEWKPPCRYRVWLSRMSGVVRRAQAARAPATAVARRRLLSRATVLPPGSGV